MTEKAQKTEKPQKTQKAGQEDRAQKEKKGRQAAAAQAVVKLQTGLIEKAGETPRLKKLYHENVVPGMMKDLGKDNPHAVARLSKIVVNMGVSDAKESVQFLDSAREELAAITGQRPQMRRAKQSISNFKLREGMPIGIRVTLRGDRMFEFLDRLVTTAVPRIRDFRGLDPRGFDGRGNYNLGLREHHIFPEIDLTRSPKPRGMNITFVTTADSDNEGLELLGRLGVPFRKIVKGKDGQGSSVGN